MSNYKKVFILLLAIVFVLEIKSENKNWNEETREFWKAYLGVIKGKDFKMDIDCLSGKFNDYIEILKKEIEKGDLAQIIFNLKLILDLEIEKCPVADYLEILKDFQKAAKNGTLIKNAFKNYSLIENKLNKYLKSDKSSCALGTFVGEMTKMVTYGMSYTTWEDPHKHKNLLS